MAKRKAQPKHPMQPVYLDKSGVARFKPNKIIEYLFERGTLDLNLLAFMKFEAEDRMQIAQLLGYSVSGFGDLGYADPKIVEQAGKEVAKLLAGRQGK